MGNDSEVKIVEVKDVPEEIKIIFGLPDVGLVGVIAAAHLISKLNLKEVAYIETELLPPIVILESGLPRSSIRIFEGGGIAILSSEIAIPLDIIYPLVKSVIEWAWKKKAEKV
ncbi:MAG: PAC2 family protein, partial [Candidatus Bathyarchaeia archaeon]